MRTRGERPILWLGVFLFVAAAVQSSLADRMYAWGGQPDFVFAVVLAAALLSDASRGSVIGLCGGLLTAALVGETVGTFLVSRTLGGFVAGWLSSRLFRANAAVVIASVLTASFAGEALYVLAAPRIGLGVWLPAALVGAAWNAVLAVPITLLLRRAGWEKGRS